MLDKIKEFKRKVEEVKETHPFADKIGRGSFSKLLVMANLAEMCIYSNTKVPAQDRNYFEGQATVGRYFSDWGLDWIATDYLEICEYIKHNNW